LLLIFWLHLPSKEVWSLGKSIERFDSRKYVVLLAVIELLESRRSHCIFNKEEARNTAI
jgi:hypothetical protein